MMKHKVPRADIGNLKRRCTARDPDDLHRRLQLSGASSQALGSRHRYLSTPCRRHCRNSPCLNLSYSNSISISHDRSLRSHSRHCGTSLPAISDPFNAWHINVTVRQGFQGSSPSRTVRWQPISHTDSSPQVATSPGQMLLYLASLGRVRLVRVPILF